MEVPNFKYLDFVQYYFKLLIFQMFFDLCCSYTF